MLPKIDGFGVCERIRRQSRVPVLMLTALDGEAEQLRGFGMDADDYVTKPFSMPVLLEKIRVNPPPQRGRGGGRPAVPGPDPRPGRPGGPAGRPPPGSDRPGVRAAAHLPGRAGPGVHPGNAAGQAVGLRLLRRRAGGGQPHQKPPPQAGAGLYRDREGGGLPCCEGSSLRA